MPLAVSGCLPKRGMDEEYVSNVCAEVKYKFALMILVRKKHYMRDRTQKKKPKP